jgi:hypothetical protein
MRISHGEFSDPLGYASDVPLGSGLQGLYPTLIGARGRLTTNWIFHSVQERGAAARLSVVRDSISCTCD